MLMVLYSYPRQTTGGISGQIKSDIISRVLRKARHAKVQVGDESGDHKVVGGSLVDLTRLCLFCPYLIWVQEKRVSRLDFVQGSLMDLSVCLYTYELQ